ncbi:hypothetical protein [Dyella subtropica]|uniref:hypothetical protein n=1 Tax=Dyella subtropica TaxID=2992127 RepID=UPI00225296CD|nr:hypothetical protein [Dyella subtropica]
MTIKFELSKLGNWVRKSVIAAVVGGTFGGAAMAQTTTSMDVTGPLAVLAAAVVAVNLIGPAKAGIRFLKYAWSKIA